jgi:PhzF family phenazine biosynthesis protein
MGTYQYVVADVFTDIPLEGNPVAVFVDSAGIPPERMQQIAQEMHLSETVFVLSAENDGDVRVRIFTPVNELPFAGHPTLGTAIVLGFTVSLITVSGGWHDCRYAGASRCGRADHRWVAGAGRLHRGQTRYLRPHRSRSDHQW